MRWIRLKNTLRSSFIASFVLLVSSIFCALFFFSSSASAFSFGTSGNRLFYPNLGHSQFTVYNGTYQEGVGPTYTVPLAVSADSNFLTGNTNSVDAGAGGNLTQVRLQTTIDIPAGSLFSFSVRYLTTQYQHAVEYRGQFATNFALLNSSCNSIADTDNGNTTFTSGYTCTYWGYNSSTTDYLIFNPSVYFDVPLIVQTSRGLTYVTIVSESGGSSGLSQADKDFLASQISSIRSSGTTDSQAIISQLQSNNTTMNGLRSDIQAQTEQQHDDYENEVQREEDKQDELEEQSGDLSLSAQSTGNPFAQFFTTNDCITLTSISSWFNVSPAIQVCSPYPSNIRPILTFITSAVVAGLLIRLYYKHLNGGFNS